MSKLDNIILSCINKALDGKEGKLGDYVDPTKEEIKKLFLEIIGDDERTHPLDECDTKNYRYPKARQQYRLNLRKKVREL